MNGLQHTSAFVIQFRAGVADGSDELSGRIEHVASGRTETFQSIQEVPALLLRMLAERENQGRQCRKGEAKVKRHLAGSLLLMVLFLPATAQIQDEEPQLAEFQPQARSEQKSNSGDAGQVES